MSSPYHLGESFLHPWQRPRAFTATTILIIAHISDQYEREKAEHTGNELTWRSISDREE